MQKLKQIDPKWGITAGLGATVILSLLVAIGLWPRPQADPSNQSASIAEWSLPQTGPNAQVNGAAFQHIPESLVFPLSTVAAEERAETLSAIANGTHPNQKQAQPLDSSRARYLIAVDALSLNDPQRAITALEGLEADYPGMEPAVLYQRARAYSASNEPAAATQTWQQLFQTNPDHPFAAEALYALGQTDPQYRDQAIERFPSHPRTIAVAKARLEQNPNQPNMLRLLAHHALYEDNIVEVLDQLTTSHGASLTPDDWAAIGYAYWEKWQYGKASRAYAQAEQTPLHAYRAGRGAHLDGRTQDAIAYYKAAAAAFPTEKDTAQAYLHLSRLAPAQEALPYLDQLYTAFPDRQAEALLARARVYEALNSSVSANQARQSILTQHSTSDTAAEMRWEQAQTAASQGQWVEAWQWAGQIVQDNPESDWAAEAAFWVGKWAEQMGRGGDATQAYEYVLKRYPDSYYAWRSAAKLGWNVRDFQTVGRYSPALTPGPGRSPLPSGSPLLQELYFLGQDQDAWAVWQVEFPQQRQPTVAEQYTDGILNVGVGHYLRGIFLLENLDWRPTEDGPFTAEVAMQTPSYWQTVYPIPYFETIRAWSHQRQINPLLVLALMRQESRFQPAIISSAGATGLMQVMPGTADWVAGQLGIEDYNLKQPHDSIKLGTWYLDYTHGEYADNSMFAIASYNAGPGNVAKWIDRFGVSDLDVFATQIPFPETKGYVTSVFGNYWNYLRLYNPDIAQALQQVQK